MRSIAVRPSSFSRLNCCAGRQFVVEHDGVGVDGEADLLELVDLALADVPRVIGRVAALHEAFDDVGTGGVDEQFELVEARVDRLLGGARAAATPTITIFSRTVRSIRVAPSASWYGVFTQTSISIVAT